ncbi:MAG TPA: flagellar biosynthetic protein FliO [Tepidisphaeraceae bacterium]|nr:flagellar biosynthetic protein FliO [Tepidisphaeraceae bacterium]
MKIVNESARAWMRGMALAAWLVAQLVACAPNFAQTTRPISTGSMELQPVRRAATTEPSSAGALPHAVVPHGALLDFQRLAISLTIVISLIFFLRWVARRFFPNLAGSKASSVVRLLGRSPISPKQQVLLVQVGKRVLVVADNGAQLSRLTEITEADEVAWIIGRVSGNSTESSSKFSESLTDAEQSFDAVETSQPPSSIDIDVEPIESARGDLDGLMRKIRGLAKQIGNP